jgi:hypothetical protein
LGDHTFITGFDINPSKLSAEAIPPIPPSRRLSLTFNHIKNIGEIMSTCKFLLQALLSILLLIGTAFAESNQEGIKATSLEKIMVTAEKIQEYVKNHPQDIKIAERKEVALRNLVSVEDVLKNMSGVEMYITAGIGSQY